MKKLTPAVAVHKHERALHKGQPLTPMKHGGEVMRSKMASKPMSPKRPVSPAGAPMKKGGRACMNMGGAAPMPTPNAKAMANANENARFKRPAFAAGGVAKIRHKQATSAGKPLAPKGRFSGSLI